MLKFALVGCGRIAKRHSELLGMDQIEGAKLVAACDSDATKAAEIGRQFSIPHFTDMHKMMQSTGINVWLLDRSELP
jgi:UDP-N-acetyl-2-amino-2-deoxyglucuronate dehydrogenase